MEEIPSLLNWILGIVGVVAAGTLTACSVWMVKRVSSLEASVVEATTVLRSLGKALDGHSQDIKEIKQSVAKEILPEADRRTKEHSERIRILELEVQKLEIQHKRESGNSGIHR